MVEGAARQHALRVDLPTAWGGDDTAATPLETQAFILGACLMGALRGLARQEKIDIRALSARVEGTVDLARGMGKDTDLRAGFFRLHVVLHVDVPLEGEAKRSFVRRALDRCPISDNLAHPTPLEVRLGEDAVNLIAETF